MGLSKWRCGLWACSSESGGHLELPNSRCLLFALKQPSSPSEAMAVCRVPSAPRLSRPRELWPGAIPSSTEVVVYLLQSAAN